MNVFVGLGNFTQCFKYEFLIKKIPGILSLKPVEVYLDSKTLKNKLSKNLLIYFYDEADKKYIVIVKYSKNMNVADKIIKYFNIKETINFYNVFNSYICGGSSLSSEFQLIVPTNVKDFDDLLNFSRQYKIKEIDLLLVGKQAKYIQNMFE